MNHLFVFILFVIGVLLSQSSVQGTIYACNTTASCGCSQNQVNINARIVGGEPSVSRSWAWAVSLRIQKTRHFCGGTILSPHYILTAAHCVDDRQITGLEITVAVGTDTLNGNFGQRIVVSKIYKHPGWNTNTKENDIALLKLDKAISFTDRNITKLCLPSLTGFTDIDFPWTNTKLVAIGWGSTAYGGSVSNVLRQVTLAAVGSKETKCISSIRNSRVQFCAAVNGGGKDTCQGDSGGPLMYYSYEYRQWMIAGITSYGRGCALSNYAGVYTRASMYINWIKSVVGKDGVVIAGENTATVATMSNIFYVATLSVLILLYTSQ